MLLKPGNESEQRIANWLNAVLQDVHDGDADEATFFDMLDILRDYVVSVKVCFFTERRETFY
jgi:centromere protein I